MYICVTVYLHALFKHIYTINMHMRLYSLRSQESSECCDKKKLRLVMEFTCDAEIFA